MRLVLVVLSVALMALITDTAQAQKAADDQYNSPGDDQYGSSGVGHDAANDAMQASRFFGDASDDEAASEEGRALAVGKAPSSTDPEAASVEESAETKEAHPEEGVATDSLPETGGISPLFLGVLLVVGGVLIRPLARLAFAVGEYFSPSS
jgi:hypothetical protein